MARSAQSRAKQAADGQGCVCPYNEFIAVGVQKVVEAAVQNKNANLNIISTYRKALQSIQKSPLPINSIDDIKRLKYVGTYLSVEIQKIIRSEGLALQPSSVSDSVLDNVNSNEEDRPPTSKRAKVQREYIPRFQSGAYAILIAMAKEDRVFRKGELIIAAQPYSETSFTAVDVNGTGSNFYNAWSGMTTLLSKDFVLKSGSPARYELTDTGRALGKKLLASWLKQSEASSPDENAAVQRLSQPSIIPQISGVSIQSNYSDYEVVLVIDTAEQFRENRNKVLIEFQNQNLKAERARLSIGDYCWVARRKLSQGLVGSVMLPFIVERKKDADLSGSIRDLRYEEQKFRLKQTGLKVIYILEGDPNSGNLVDPKSILSAISRMTTVDGFFVYQTNDIDNTIRLLCSIQKGLLEAISQQQVPLDAEPFFTFNDRLEKSAIPDASHKFGTLLMALNGVSSYRCEAIIAKYPSVPALLAAYDQCECVSEEERLLESIEYLSKGISKARMGIAVSKNIRSFFRDCSYTSRCRSGSANRDASTLANESE